MNTKKVFSKVAAAALAGTMLLSCAYAAGTDTKSAALTTGLTQSTGIVNSTSKKPKYVFLFIGDGMSYPQFQAASDYLGAVADTDNDDILDGNKALNFMNFPVAGSAVTYDSTSFCPDSASTATSISTGHKTYSGTINMDETMTVKYETIAEQLKDEGYDIGVVSSVNLNHATPAAFYCHQASRNNYYEIGEELIASDFDYFAGGALLKPNGADGDKESLYDRAEEAGYKVVNTQAEAEKISAKDEKVLLISEKLADGDSISYENDRANGEWALADYVDKGIEVLSDNDKGFFMMVEGGKIDWACHANDAGSAINDTLALADAVDEALEFAKDHADETLILVTGDHETGGLTIGYAGTDYDTYLTNLTNQKISYAKFDSDYVTKYKENQTSFEDMMKDVEQLFGLKMSGAEDDKLVLTDYEIGLLKEAYAKTLADEKADEENQAEYVLYGTYEPLSVTITHLLNNKSGIDFTSYSHTGLPVAVFAKGVGQDEFGGYYDNTQIYHKLADLMDIK
ncbi:alkaline phosphatase [uncultured Negativibacillus sp.]|uniref:alkaline phosphatase n=1 Tax=uncultured Negativibacillus sp. TaxID=1980696 RepID=UPI0025D5C18D|nr:alkaline phosphatase [uncultured Negativibacillus sp.]